MIKSRIFLIAALLAIIGIALISCRKEQSPSPATSNQDVLLLKSDYTDVDCDLACLQTGPFEQTTNSFIRQWAPVPGFPGYYKNNRYIVVTAWNDANYFYIKTDVFGYQYNREKVNGVWTLTGPTYNNYPFETVVITLNGSVINYSMDDPSSTDVIETAETYTQAYSLPAGWANCNEMIYSVKILGGGQQVWLGTPNQPADITYGLIGFCSSTTLNVSPSNTVSPGTEVTLTAAVSSTGLFTGGFIKIQEFNGIEYTDLATSPVTSDNQMVSYAFTPQENGTHTFIARYDGFGSNGYKQSESEPVTLTVAGTQTGLVGQAISCSTSREANYLFTFQGDAEYVKIQGSLTNFSGPLAIVELNNVPVEFDIVEYILDTDETIYSGDNVTGYLVKQIIPGFGTDRFITVEGPASGGQSIAINLTWNGMDISGPITGEWTAEDNGGNILASEDPLTCE